MRIDNATHWDPKQIRAIAMRVAQDELDPSARKRFTVRVRYGGRGAGVSGHAHYHSLSCQVNLGSDAVDPVNLAHTLAHEFAHTRGVRHRQMFGSVRYTYIDGWREFWGWAKDYPVERKAPKPKPTVDERRATRLAHAQTMMLRWQRKVKTAETWRRKWARRVRAIESQERRAASRVAPAGNQGEQA